MPLLDQLPLCFASDNSGAEEKFREACGAAGLEIEAHPHPLLGMKGEPLATLVARDGPMDAKKLVIMLSGTHGLEGLAGSGCQVAWLRHARQERPADTAVLLVHLVNPWGCAWQRRQTEENVDLNRSFLNREGSLPHNELYGAFHQILTGAGLAVAASEDPSIAAFFAERDEARAFGMLMVGQHQYPDGLAFCGKHPSWSQQALKQILDRHAQFAQRVAVIDIHTGLGPYGHGALYALADMGSDDLARARQWFGPSLNAVKEGNGAYNTQGELLNWVASELPGETTGVVIEYGTFELRELIMLQIDDARVWHAGEEQSPRGDEVRRRLLHFFYPASFDWLQSVAFRALQIVDMTYRGLCIERP
jgi:hypothetical protein